MPFLTALGRALLLLCIFPVAISSIAGVYLPGPWIDLPLLGYFGWAQLFFLIAFVIGFVFYAMNPSGGPRGPEEDFSEEYEAQERAERERL